ncbi:putative ABC transporter ATP-binding protein C20G4.01 [Symbiodinium microadriaticum]|uniref:Putative ABC transporter ATP-binding protein C20G4.01 n=1 Tax=Symbiodinium microadriaticum TaxID=2951 RepID=A0A1Q9DR37_SYMMI|nr:putative ABC transporter ATP-binding protein C20G4.01 [Symbiodinium microadriaticum]
MAPSGAVKVCGEDPFRGRGEPVVMVTGGWRGTVDAAMEERMAQVRVAELVGIDAPPAADSHCGKLFQALDLAPLLSKFFGVLSEGERRRVELARRLREPKRVILLDEVTSELDMLVRKALLDFLAETGSTVFNVTHVFEGLAGWPSHVLQLSQGKLLRFEPFSAERGSIFKQTVAWLSATREDSLTPLRAPPFPRHSSSEPTAASLKSWLGPSLDATSAPSLILSVLPPRTGLVFHLPTDGSGASIDALKGARFGGTCQDAAAGPSLDATSAPSLILSVLPPRTGLVFHLPTDGSGASIDALKGA